MTIPSTYKVAPTGNGAFTAQKIGGVVIGVTSATDTTDGQPVTEVFDLKSQGTDGVDRRTAPKDTDITVEAKGAATGTFAYDQSAFMIIGNQANNKINNSASTALTINGHESARDNERSSLTPIGAKTSTAWRNGSFEYLGVSAQRTPWGSGTPDPMNAANYADGDTSTATTVDDAVGTQAVPGELAFMYGALIPNTGEYSARTGG
jgi:hypothetical protein